MVWSALIYAATASFLSWWVGRPLVRLNAERYAREADLRYGLVRANEHVDSITLHGGEADEERRLHADLGGVLAAMWRVVWATTRLRWVTAGYGWFTIVAPILVAAPAYFHGSLTFGELMVVLGAFNQVQGALRWYIDNFSVIADWRATFVRVTHFRQPSCGRIDLDEAAEQRIELVPSSEERMAFIDLEVATPGGAVALKEREVTIGPGERVAVVGLPGAGKTMLFRAIAGLWPWGSGRNRATAPGRHGLHTAPSLSSSGLAQGRARLPGRRASVSGCRLRGVPEQRGPGAASARPRSKCALGPEALRGRPAGARDRAGGPAQAALDHRGRRAGAARP